MLNEDVEMGDLAAHKIADWAWNVMNSALPAQVAHQARRCIIDVTGCAAAGKGASAVGAVAASAPVLFGAGDCTVWYSDMTLSPVGAGMVNATAAMILDIDDGSRQASGHAGAGVVPAVLALGEFLKSDRDAILKAVTIGYEVAVRVGRAEKRRSYHSANYTAFGVTAAAAALKGLDAGQIAHALGICAYYGPRVSDLTLSQEMGSDVKESLPWAVVVGMSCAELAGNGFLGNRDALNIEERFDSEWMLDGLGSEFLILSTYFKRYSCCRWTHTAVEALLTVMQEHDLKPEEVEAVDVQTFNQAAWLNNRYEPQTLIDAQFSVPYVMAIAAIKGEQSLMPMTSDVLDQPVIEAFARKIKLHISEEMNAQYPARVPCHVVVHSRRGEFEAEVNAPWGEPYNKPSDAELIEKFVLIARARLEREKVMAIADAILADEAGFDSLYAALAGADEGVLEFPRQVTG
ncbi:MmgE/PrpD family protein [Falsochrobactrum shanghaiense]|nr:MmgE/PrpD family protein [Falsochrobactrum shanghaiense]